MFIVIGLLPGGLLVVGDARARIGIVQGLVVGNGRAETIGVGEDVVQVVEPGPRLLLLWVEQPEVALLPIEVQPTGHCQLNESGPE